MSISKSDIHKLSIMYDGDIYRDASSKIRGFLFQDYVTIKCLLQDNVEYVCSEYIEDVDVFFSDGTFEFIQVKYYPNTSPDKKEISTDLYYQFIRLQMLHSTLKVKPSLYIHRKPIVEPPTIENMEGYVGLDTKKIKKVIYPNADDSEKWLRDNVYKESKKETQKSKLFEEMASEDSIRNFIKELKINHQEDIKTYKEKLMTELAEKYANYKNGVDENSWKTILLGLAISCIQDRYSLDNPTFEDIKVSKEEFDTYIIQSVTNQTEKAITSYLIGLASSEYAEIIDNNRLTQLQINYLNRIYRNTVQWLCESTNSHEGQYQLINTLSKDEYDIVFKYQSLSLNDRIIRIAEIRDAFINFIDYLWKIMINICQEKIGSEDEIERNLKLFDPCSYIDKEVCEYVCLNFPDDRYANHSVILSPVGKFRRDTRNIVGRMIATSPRPEKWMFKNSNIVHGKNYYDYSTSNVADNPTVADLGKDYFYIECMDCIGVDDTEWGISEKCSDCIFLDKCVKEGH